MKVKVTPSLKKDYYDIEIKQEEKETVRLHLEKSEAVQLTRNLDNSIKY